MKPLAKNPYTGQIKVRQTTLHFLVVLPKLTYEKLVLTSQGKCIKV